MRCFSDISKRLFWNLLSNEWKGRLGRVSTCDPAHCTYAHVMYIVERRTRTRGAAESSATASCRLTSRWSPSPWTRRAGTSVKSPPRGLPSPRCLPNRAWLSSVSTSPSFKKYYKRILYYESNRLLCSKQRVQNSCYELFRLLLLPHFYDTIWTKTFETQVDSPELLVVRMILIVEYQHRLEWMDHARRLLSTKGMGIKKKKSWPICVSTAAGENHARNIFAFPLNNCSRSTTY